MMPRYLPAPLAGRTLEIDHGRIATKPTVSPYQTLRLLSPVRK